MSSTRCSRSSGYASRAGPSPRTAIRPEPSLVLETATGATASTRRRVPPCLEAGRPYVPASVGQPPSTHGANESEEQAMKHNLAARAGRWSASHWKTATVGWIAFVVLAVVLGGAIGTKQLGDTDAPGESGRVAKILDESFDRHAEETVLVQSRTSSVDDAAFRAAVDDVVARLARVSAVTNLRSPLEPAHVEQISPDGRSALVRLDIRGPPDAAVDEIGSILAAVDAAKAAHPGLFIGTIGEASAEKEIGDAVGKD